MLTFLKFAMDDGSAVCRTRIAALYALLITVNIVANAWAMAAFSGGPALLRTAFLAYVLGLRHAVDAEYIAAIDNAISDENRWSGHGYN